MRFFAAFIVALLCVSTIPATTAGGDGVHWNGYNLDRESVQNSVLIDQDGNNYALHTGSADVNVVAFIFTTCVDVCPVITSNLVAAESKLDDVDFQFISITVDPATDTPEVLKDYTDEFGVDWPHLTGEISDLEEVWSDFQIAVETEVIETDDHDHDVESPKIVPEDYSTVTVVDSSENADLFFVEPNGWDQLTAAEYQNNWTINASESQWGHYITGVNGDDSPSDYSWWWELHVWNLSTNAWEESNVGIDSVDVGQLALAPNSTDDTLIPIPDMENDTFVIVQSDGQNDSSVLSEISAWHLTLAALDSFDAPSSLFGHYMSSIDNLSAPSDYSWWWQLHYWNFTNNSWEESQYGMDNLYNQTHIAWAPNSTSDTLIPAPEFEVMTHKLGVVYPGGDTAIYTGNYTRIEMVNAMEHSIYTLDQSDSNYVMEGDSAISIDGNDGDYNLYIWHEMEEYSHWMSTSDSSFESYLVDDYDHYAWVANGEDASSLPNPEMEESHNDNQTTTSTSHSTQTFILDEDWKPIVVFLGYDWNVDDFVEDVERAANSASNPSSDDDDSGLPGFTFVTVATGLGLAIIANSREE